MKHLGLLAACTAPLLLASSGYAVGEVAEREPVSIEILTPQRDAGGRLQKIDLLLTNRSQKAIWGFALRLDFPTVQGDDDGFRGVRASMRQPGQAEKPWQPGESWKFSLDYPATNYDYTGEVSVELDDVYFVDRSG